MNDDLVAFAEQATLGALLLHPDMIGQVSGWLRASDFATNWHTHVYAALLDRHAAGDRINAETIAADVGQRTGTLAGDGLRVIDLLTTAPVRPQPGAYARMVAEAGLRREVCAQGILLRAGALQTVLSDDPQPLTSACLMVDAGLDTVGRRWADTHGRPRPSSTAPIPLRGRPLSLELRTGADKYLSAFPGRDPVVERVHQVELIAALIAHPDALPDVAAWLTPTAIHDPGWRAVYGAACHLAGRGAPIDVLTVAWTAAVLEPCGVPVPSINELRDAVDLGWHDHPRRAARLVAGEHVRALADTAADQLTARSADPATSVDDLIESAHSFTTALRRAAIAVADPSAGSRTRSGQPVGAAHGPVAR